MVTQRRRATAVLLSIEAYEQGERERELLRLLLQGDREIGQGEGHDLDEILAEAASTIRSSRRSGFCVG